MKTPILLALMVAAALATTACSKSGTAKAAKANTDHKPAPVLVLPDEQGNTIRLADFKGKVVVLNFWATWCGPCKFEIPWLIEFQRQYKDQGFSVIGVSMDEGGWPAVRPFLEEAKTNYPILLGTDETAAAFGGIEVLPTTFIIDRQGRITSTHMGLTGKDDFENAIKAAL